MRDFDAAFAELDEQPIRLRLFGQDWEVQRSVPAAAVLATLRVQEAVDGDNALLGVASTIDSCRAFLGEENVNAWLAKGLSVERLVEILAWVQSQRAGGGDDVGEAPAPSSTTA